MIAARWISCLWPGLPQLWQRGSWAGLASALAWGLLAHWLIAATFVWSEVAGLAVVRIGWGTLALLWLAGFVYSVLWLLKRARFDDDDARTSLLQQAQIEYLKGNWPAAELPTVYRGPYEYSHPDREEDYWPQNVPG